MGENCLWVSGQGLCVSVVGLWCMYGMYVWGWGVWIGDGVGAVCGGGGERGRVGE